MNNQIKKYSLRKFKGVGLALAAIGVISTSNQAVQANEVDTINQSVESTSNDEDERFNDLIVQPEKEIKDKIDGCNCKGIHVCGLSGYVTDSNTGNMFESESNIDATYEYTGLTPENSLSTTENFVFEEAYKSEDTFVVHTPYSIDDSVDIPSEKIIIDESKLHFEEYDVVKKDNFSVRDLILANGTKIHRTVNGIKEEVGQFNSASIYEGQPIAKNWDHEMRLTAHVKVVRAVNTGNWSTLLPNVNTLEEAHLARNIITPYMYADAKAAMRRAEVDYENQLKKNIQLSEDYIQRYTELKENFAALTNKYNRFMGYETPIEYSRRDSASNNQQFEYVKSNVDSVLNEMPEIFKQYVNYIIYYNDDDSNFYAYTHSVDGRIYINVGKFANIDKSNSAWTLYHEIGHIIDGKSFSSPDDSLVDLTEHDRDRILSYSRREDFVKVDNLAYSKYRNIQERFADSIALYATRKMGYFKENSIHSDNTRNLIDKYIESTIIPVISVRKLNQFDASKIHINTSNRKKITTSTTENDIIIPIENETIYDSSLNVGETRFVNGVEGLNKEIVVTTYENGIESSTQREIKQVREMRKSQTIVGSKPVIKKENVNIDFNEIEVIDNSINVGEIRIEEGSVGVKEITHKKELVNGQIVESSSEKIISQPKNKIKRIGSKPIVREEKVDLPFNTVKQYDESLPVGETSQIDGKKGSKVITHTTYLDNNEVKHSVSERIEKQPVNAILKIGTKFVVTTESSDITYSEIVRYDENLQVGEVKVSEGVNGRKIITKTKYLENDEVKESTDVQTIQPVNKIITYGTKETSSRSEEIIPYKVLTVESNELFKGEETVKEGINGVKITIITRTLNKNTNTVEESVSYETIQPSHEIRKIGVKEREIISEESSDELEIDHDHVEESNNENSTSTDNDNTSEVINTETVVENDDIESNTTEKDDITETKENVTETKEEVIESDETKEDVVESSETKEDVVESNNDKDDITETKEDVTESNENKEEVIESDKNKEDVIETKEEVTESDEEKEEVTETKEVIESNDDKEEIAETKEDVVESNETKEDVVESNETKEDVIKSNDDNDGITEIKEDVIESDETKEEITETKEDVIESKEDKEEITETKEDVIESNRDKEEITEIKEDVIESDETKEEITETKEDMIESNEDKDEITETKEDVIESNEDKDEITEIKEDVIESNETKEEITEIKEDVIESNETKEEITEIKEDVVESNEDKDEITEIKEDVIESNDTKEDEITEIKEDVIESNENKDDVVESNEKTDEIKEDSIESNETKEEITETKEDVVESDETKEDITDNKNDAIESNEKTEDEITDNKDDAIESNETNEDIIENKNDVIEFNEKTENVITETKEDVIESNEKTDNVIETKEEILNNNKDNVINPNNTTEYLNESNDVITLNSNYEILKLVEKDKGVVTTIKLYNTDNANQNSNTNSTNTNQTNTNQTNTNQSNTNQTNTNQTNTNQTNTNQTNTNQTNTNQTNTNQTNTNQTNTNQTNTNQTNTLKQQSSKAKDTQNSIKTKDNNTKDNSNVGEAIKLEQTNQPENNNDNHYEKALLALVGTTLAASTAGLAFNKLKVKK